MRILLVEDDLDARELLALMLAPYEVYAVATVDEAVLAVDKRCPDLIVSDLRLGNDSARRLVVYLAEQGREIPVIIITGLVGVDDEPEGLIKAFLTKPFESAVLVGAVERIMAATCGPRP